MWVVQQVSPHQLHLGDPSNVLQQTNQISADDQTLHKLQRQRDGVIRAAATFLLSSLPGLADMTYKPRNDRNLSIGRDIPLGSLLYIPGRILL